jgi:hypothetical protein
MTQDIWKALVAVESYIQRGIVEQLRASPQGFGGDDMKPVHDAYRILREQAPKLSDNARAGAEDCLVTAAAGLNSCLNVLRSYADGTVAHEEAIKAFDRERESTLSKYRGCMVRLEQIARSEPDQNAGQDWAERYEHKLGHPEAIARLVAMHRLINDKRREAAASNYRVKLFLLATSALTTGALWALMGGAFPQPIKWIGTILSTIVTAVNAFQLTLGPAKAVEQLDELYSEFGRTLADAREHPTNFSWHNFKHLESVYLRSGVPEPRPEQVEAARATGMI